MRPEENTSRAKWLSHINVTCLCMSEVIIIKVPSGQELGDKYSSLNKFETDETEYPQYTPKEEEELYLLLVYSNSTRTKQRKCIKKRNHRIAVHHFIKTCPNNSIYWPIAFCNLAPSSGYIIKKQLLKYKIGTFRPLLVQNQFVYLS